MANDAVVEILACRREAVDILVRPAPNNAARAGAVLSTKPMPGATLFGVGRHDNIVTASLQAVLSAVNRALQRGLLDDAMPAAAASVWPTLCLGAMEPL